LGYLKKIPLQKILMSHIYGSFNSQYGSCYLIEKSHNPQVSQSFASDSAHPTCHPRSTASAAPITSLRLDLVIYKEL
jgi:hypothetical protein